MQTTGIKRKIDFQGRICIPRQVRDELHLELDDTITIDVSDGVMHVSPTNKRCVFCGKITSHTFQNKPICKECITKLTSN